MIRLIISPITLPAGITHVSTTWEVSQITDFTSSEDIVLRVSNDTEDLLEKTFDYDIPAGGVLYGRVKLHFSDGGNTDWSDTIVIDGTEDGFEFTGTIIATPVVTINQVVNETSLGGFIITASDFLLYAGTGTHQATSWKIVSTNGVTVWERPNDNENLNSVTVPEYLLNYASTYQIHVVYHNQYNTVSNAGILTIVTEGDRLVGSAESMAYKLTEFTETTQGQTQFDYQYRSEDVVQVFYNGWLLTEGAWSLSGGNLLTLQDPIDVDGDVITVIRWNRFTLADAITNADLASALTNTYSKEDASIVHNELKNALVSLGGGQGNFENTTTPVVLDIPVNPSKTLLNFTTVEQSILINVFELDETNNLFVFKQDGRFVFISTLNITSNIDGVRNLTLNLVDDDTDVVVDTKEYIVNIPNGESGTYILTSVLDVTGSANIRIEISCDDTGLKLNTFKGTLLTNTGYDLANTVGTVTDFETALV